MERSGRMQFTAATAAVLATGMLLMGTSSVRADETSDLERFGDYMQLVLPAAA